LLRICRIRLSVWRSQTLSVLLEIIKISDNCKWCRLAGEQQAGEETNFQGFRKHMVIHQKKAEKQALDEEKALSFC